MSKKKKLQPLQGSHRRLCQASEHDPRPIHILFQALGTFLYCTFILEPCQRANDFPRSQIC